MTAQHHAAPHKVPFAIKSVDFCYVGGMKASSNFSPGKESTRIILSRIFRLITEKNTSPFLWCSRLMFSAPQYPSFPAGYSQSDVLDWAPGEKANLCKTAVDSFPINSSSRHNSKVTRKLRSSCSPMSSCT
ncbi:hypothetical protein TNCV_4745071 [Trichonephila clavipes]|nr:hypothetical protein TNCV_4745071 [Trichonephila clavipes]